MQPPHLSSRHRLLSSRFQHLPWRSLPLSSPHGAPPVPGGWPAPLRRHIQRRASPRLEWLHVSLPLRRQLAGPPWSSDSSSAGLAVGSARAGAAAAGGYAEAAEGSLARCALRAERKATLWLRARRLMAEARKRQRGSEQRGPPHARQLLLPPPPPLPLPASQLLHAPHPPSLPEP